MKVKQLKNDDGWPIDKAMVKEIMQIADEIAALIARVIEGKHTSITFSLVVRRLVFKHKISAEKIVSLPAKMLGGVVRVLKKRNRRGAR